MKKSIWPWIKASVFALGFVILVRTFLFTSCIIPFTGMENTLYQGDRVVVDKWAYGFRVPFVKVFGYHRWRESPVSKNQIVVFNAPFSARGMQQEIDRRDVFISRCVGLPGDTLMLDPQRNLTRQPQPNPDYKALYAYPSKAEDTLRQAMSRLGIQPNELIGYQDELYIRSLSYYEVYLLRQEIGKDVKFTPLQTINKGAAYPLVIPRKGERVSVYPWNARLLADAISRHEGEQAEVRRDTLYVNGNKTFSYLFKQDYYWMVSNNSANVNDSRRFGLVPASHLIGQARFVWFSKDPGEGWMQGYRWNRFFHLIK